MLTESEQDQVLEQAVVASRWSRKLETWELAWGFYYRDPYNPEHIHMIEPMGMH